MSDIEFIYLHQADVKATGIDMKMAMQAVEESFVHHHRGKVILPFKTVLDMGERRISAEITTYLESSGLLGFPKTPSVLDCRGERDC